MPSTHPAIKNNPQLRTLAETDTLLLGHVFETAFLYQKSTGEALDTITCAADPTCGLIGANNDWYLLGGETLVFKTLNDEDWDLPEKLEHIFALKALGAYTVQVLTDPWTDTAAIWQLDIAPDLSVKLFKVKDFGAYRDKPYTEDIVW